jgi:hypothetical protein
MNSGNPDLRDDAEQMQPNYEPCDISPELVYYKLWMNTVHRCGVWEMDHDYKKIRERKKLEVLGEYPESWFTAAKKEVGYSAVMDTAEQMADDSVDQCYNNSAHVTHIEVGEEVEWHGEGVTEYIQQPSYSTPKKRYHQDLSDDSRNCNASRPSKSQGRSCIESEAEESIEEDDSDDKRAFACRDAEENEENNATNQSSPLPEDYSCEEESSDAESYN